MQQLLLAGGPAATRGLLRWFYTRQLHLPEDALQWCLQACQILHLEELQADVEQVLQQGQSGIAWQVLPGAT